MKLIFASDSFKGTLSSERIIEILKKRAKAIWPDVQSIGIPIADGGEGTINAIMHTAGGQKRKKTVHGPLSQPVEAEYLILNDGRVLIEMAQASGITLIPFEEGNALKTTSYGTGELILDALQNGYRDLTISIGGSATNDGGVGMLAALGVKFFDKNGLEILPTGGTLISIDRIDISQMVQEASEATFTVMCDVKNPLLGSNGATYIYGPQKGATKEQLEHIEKGMTHYAGLIEKLLGKSVASEEGAGAAGGMGAALMAFFNARQKSGIQTVLELIDFKHIIADADLIITGEGCIDGQSACGKVLDGIGKYAKEAGIPVIAMAGGMGNGAESVYQSGIDSIMVTENRPMSLEEALSEAEELFENAAERMFRILQTGMTIQKKHK